MPRSPKPRKPNNKEIQNTNRNSGKAVSKKRNTRKKKRRSKARGGSSNNTESTIPVPPTVNLTEPDSDEEEYRPNTFVKLPTNNNKKNNKTNDDDEVETPMKSNPPKMPGATPKAGAVGFVAVALVAGVAALMAA